VRAVPQIYGFYPGICLTTEEKITEKPQSSVCKNLYVISGSDLITHYTGCPQNPIRILKMHNIIPKADTNIQSFLCFFCTVI
jgi:hypothetical protein